MLPLKSIVGVCLATMLAASAVAEPLVRPFARSDAADLRVAADAARLASFRVKARPTHMVRYPVYIETQTPTLRPVARAAFHPRTQWEHKSGNAIWTRTAMSAIDNSALDDVIPRDIDRWCPAYVQNSPTMRRAFWVGMMSALAKHESTFNPRAVGGGGLWYGLLQIYPDTARRYGCRARTGEGLKNPVDNLSCAARIMAVTVRRDRAVALHDGRWRGVAADWGPMTSRSKISEMSGWTRRQSYCTIPTLLRPLARPAAGVIAQMTPARPNARPALSATISTMDAGLRGSE